jgi:ADP-heptose:LPS heptosyltransferase
MYKENILVIKHGSLGDWIQATGAFQLIRAHHPRATITILTQPHYAPLAEACGYFDEIILDNRLPFHNLAYNLKLLSKLRKSGYDRVYDLQCSSRTNLYHFFMKGKVKKWYGRAKFCSHFVPFRPSAHAVELSYDIIKAAGIDKLPTPELGWLKTNKLKAQITTFDKFVLFVPGSSAKHHLKRWTVEGYAKVIDWLASNNIKSVLTGTAIDAKLVEAIIQACSSKPINFLNKAHFAEMAELARHSLAIIGSDTGPMHIAAATNRPSLVLFSKVSNPQKSRPWGKQVQVIKEEDLSNLSSDVVISELAKLLSKQPSRVKSLV